MGDNLKETKEFFDALFATVGQGVQSFSDGAQLTDVASFFDEALLWQKGVQGFAQNFGPEAAKATVDRIDDMFALYQDQLVVAGLDPLLASAVVTQTKGFYLIYAALKHGQASPPATVA